MVFAVGGAGLRGQEVMLTFRAGAVLNLPENTRFAHYRVSARFTIPGAAAARLRARGTFPELELRAVADENFVVTATSLALRRHRNLARSGRRDRNGCGFPPFPDASVFRVEGVCDFVLGGNPLRKHMTVARNGELLHLFSVTYRPELEGKIRGMLAGLQFSTPWRRSDETRPR